MPTFTLSLADLKSMLAKRVTDDQLRDVLPQLKISIESFGPELVVEVTPDRPDLFSTEGIARQLNQWLGWDTGLPTFKTKDSGISIVLKSPKVRPFFAGAVLRGLKLNSSAVQSLFRIQAALDAGIGRDRRKVAIGLHDLAKLKPPFAYADVKPNAVRFVPLDMTKPLTPAEILKKHPKGLAYAHLVPGSCPLLTDAKNQVLSFPPIINGELTKVTPKTTDLFIDITGTDQQAMHQSLNILAAALAMRGGRIETVSVSGKKTPVLESQKMTVKKPEILGLLGIEVKNAELKTLLERMGYDAASVADVFTVLAPPYRADLQHPVDVAEDVAIAYGYNNLTSVPPKVFSVGAPHPIETTTQRLRELAVAMGFLEVNTYTLIPEHRNAFHRSPPISLQNPLSSEFAVVRTNLLGNLLAALQANKHQKYPQRLFETGDVVVRDPSAETKTATQRLLGLAIAHSKAGFTEIASVANELNTLLGDRWTIVSTTDPAFIAGRMGALKTKAGIIGRVGEVHPKIIAALGLEVPVAVLEIDVEQLAQPVKQ